MIFIVFLNKPENIIKSAGIHEEGIKSPKIIDYFQKMDPS